MFKIYDGRSHFYQWDIDRKLIVEDASISEVHFCNQTDNYSLVCKTYIEDGLNLVNVPNILLQNDWRINVYAYDTNYTKFSERFDVIQRCKPEDYVYTETEILNYNTLSDRIDAVDKNIGVTIDKYLAEHSSNIETVVNNALTQAKESGEFDGADGITPTIGDNGNWFLGDVDTNKPSRGETGAQGEKGADGATGATGADGKSAYSYAQDGGYTGTEAEFAAKLAAEKLPNPYPLTFTGAVNETYDGSSAKTIEIPSGGGGGETIIAEETVLASGTIATETEANTFTASGITFGMLRNYKHWTVEFKSASQSTYLAAGYKIGSNKRFICRLRHRNIKFQCEWLDKEKTIIRVFFVCGSGYGYGVSDISQTTNDSAQASMSKQDQYIIADVADDTVLGFFNHDALTNDILWRVKGVFKYGN